MRFSPGDGRYVVMERGQNSADGPRRIEVADAATGAVVATFPAGFNPRWLTDATFVAESPDGTEARLFSNWVYAHYVPANRGQLDANGHGWWAVSDLHKTTVHVGQTSGAFHDARDPRLSASGHWLATRHPATGQLRLRGDDLGPDLGPCEDARWSSETLTWWLGGRVWGRTTPEQSTVELTVPGRACSKALPYWDGRTLRVGLVLDDGELWVAEWDHFTSGTYLGWRVGASANSGFDWDMRRDGGYLSVCYFDPLGRPVYVDGVIDALPLESMLKPDVPPDIPWTTNPTGVVEDIAPWLFSSNQGPDVHMSPDGMIRFYCKSDERSGDGPHPEIGEHWDRDAQYIGHLEDSSTGRRILDGKEVIAEDIVRMFPDTHAQVWAGLKLNRNTFADGRRLWLPRRCVSGTRIRYVTDITWTVPPRETPHTRVWQNIPIEIRVDVGYARIHGKEVFVRGAYIPDGHPEVNYYAPPDGSNAWVAGPFGTFDSEWMRT